MFRASRLAALGPATLAAFLAGGVVALAAFSSPASNAGNSVAAAPDFVAPQASASVVGKAQGGVAAYVKQGGGYRVYANVSDTGNPASGTQTVTADVSSVTTGQTAAALTAGSYTAGGASYNYRSAELTANASLAEGSKSFTLSLADADSNTRAQTGYSVTVDNTAPSASDVQAVNGSGTVRQPDLGDVVTFTYGEPIDAESIQAGWSGASTAVVVRIEDGGLLGNDELRVYNAANTAQLPLGNLGLGSVSYVSANRTFGASGTASTMAQSGANIVVTLGTASGSTSAPLSATTMSWTPSASAYDRAANASTTSSRSEQGSSDFDF